MGIIKNILASLLCVSVVTVWVIIIMLVINQDETMYIDKHSLSKTGNIARELPTEAFVKNLQKPDDNKKEKVEKTSDLKSIALNKDDQTISIDELLALIEKDS